MKEKREIFYDEEKSGFLLKADTPCLGKAKFNGNYPPMVHGKCPLSISFST
jgi:hypothetical protein